jgi:hypothetical protein
MRSRGWGLTCLLRNSAGAQFLTPFLSIFGYVTITTFPQPTCDTTRHRTNKKPSNRPSHSGLDNIRVEQGKRRYECYVPHPPVTGLAALPEKGFSIGSVPLQGGNIRSPHCNAHPSIVASGAVANHRVIVTSGCRHHAMTRFVWLLHQSLINILSPSRQEIHCSIISLARYDAWPLRFRGLNQDEASRDLHLTNIIMWRTRTSTSTEDAKFHSKKKFSLCQIVHNSLLVAQNEFSGLLIRRKHRKQRARNAGVEFVSFKVF